MSNQDLEAYAANIEFNLNSVSSAFDNLIKNDREREKAEREAKRRKEEAERAAKRRKVRINTAAAGLVSIFAVATIIHNSKVLYGYKGEKIDGVPNGHGSMKYFLFGTYAGEWVDGERSGQGTMDYFWAGSFTGQWQNDERHSGVLKYRNGDEYDGDFEDDVPGGFGTMTYDNGHYIDGVWFEGEWTGNGKGKMALEKNLIYEGSLLGGIPHGQGRLDDIKHDYWYDGAWQKGSPFGNGQTYFVINDEITYKGGLYTDANGKSYPHGRGVVTESNGDFLDGQFNQGIFHGQGTYKDKEWLLLPAEKYTGNWQNGNLSVRQTNGRYVTKSAPKWHFTLNEWSFE